MHATKILQQNLQKNCPHIHASRLTALVDVVEALVQGQTLTVTGLGRSLPREIRMKHGIKHSDRLIGNGHLSQERLSIYQAVTRRLLGANPQPIVLVDWSDYTYDRSHLILRAAIPVGGRGLTLYEEVHPYKFYSNAHIEKRFLQTLQAVLPPTCTPIVVTDAGFKAPWFKAVAKLGWQYLGRLSKSMLYRPQEAARWWKCQDLFAQASATPGYQGRVELVRSNPLPCHRYHYQRPQQGRHKKTKYGRQAQSKHSKKNAQRETSPWILASSLGPEAASATQVIQLYRTRMQIEEGFRDIKNQRAGLCLSETRTRSPERLANLLLVGMLATLVIWMMGRLAEEKQWQYQYQANTVKSYRVLSLFYLGCLLLVQGRCKFTPHEFQHAITLVQQDMQKQWLA